MALGCVCRNLLLIGTMDDQLARHVDGVFLNVGLLLRGFKLALLLNLGRVNLDLFTLILGV